MNPAEGHVVYVVIRADESCGCGGGAEVLAVKGSREGAERLQRVMIATAGKYDSTDVAVENWTVEP